MNCRDLEELLSAYADGELPRTQREFIEEHLSNCADCRETLNEFRTAGHMIASLKDKSPVVDIREPVLSRIKEIGTPAGSPPGKWLRPLAILAAVTVFAVVLFIAQPWEFGTSPVSAADIVRNSPEVKAFFENEPIEEVETTATVIGTEGDVLVVLARTETKAAAAEVDLKKKVVTDIMRVELPGLTEMDGKKAVEIAKADPAVRELLSEGGVIGDSNLILAVKFNETTDAYGQTIREGVAEVIGQMTIEVGEEKWLATVDVAGEKLLDLVRISPGTTITDWNRKIYNVLYPLMVALGIFMIAGLALKNRLAVTSAGVVSIALGVLALYGGLYAWPVERVYQVMALVVPVLGIIIGIMGKENRRWAAAGGIIIGMLALAYAAFSINPVLYLNMFMLPVLLGILVYILHRHIKIPPKWLYSCLSVVLVGVSLVVFLASCLPGMTGSSISTGVTIRDEDQSIRVFGLMKRLSIDDIIRNSDAVVIGEVMEIMPSKKTDPGSVGENVIGGIYTDVIVRVDKYLFGRPESEKIAVRVEGGRVDDMVMWAEDEPEFILGEKVILFLIRPTTPFESVPEGIEPSDYYRVSVQGKYRYWHGILTNWRGGGLPLCTPFVVSKIAAIHGY